ncbi:flippase-like domain-containing protein [Ferrovibrio terrae]|uniref:Flippase-like domain-containing protein n=1 Tax=Ferrovibrio terrae TaxID=2594003 RepID=A0A516GYX8_9PROT|nr:lysylphosphatidylglycerol synthase domain-containing protein [Ferrovibrio terrae]QDO96738.1 flippase-like domain-containing protein [Ferrovibrio terrae]
MARGLRLAFLALISLGSLAATLYFAGIDTVIETLGSIHWFSIVVAAVLVLANSLLSLVRFRSVLAGLGFQPSWRSLFFAHSIGQVSNQIFLNIIGQSLSRAAALAADGVPFSASVIATYWERIQAAAILFLLSLVSVWYLFVNIHFDLLPAGFSLLSVLATLAVVAVVIFAVVLRPAGMLKGLPTSLRAASRQWPSVLITLLAHACMLGAYLSLLWGIGVMRFDGEVIAALIIVMFTSSLPISFSGWGIRELSAAQALGAIGIDDSAAIASAVAIGLLYLFLVVIFAVVSTLIVMRHRKKYAAQKTQPAAVMTPGINWATIGITIGCMLCAMLLFFQLRIPVRGGELTANVADLISLTSLGLAPFFLWRYRYALPLPKLLLAGLAAVTLVFAASLAYGYSRFGWTSWAFLNRGLGWLIILGYVTTGVAIAVTTDRHRRLLLSTFIATGSTIAVLQLGLMIAALAGIRLHQDIFSLPLKAYAGNTNAFAVQMVMTSAAAIAAWHLGIFGRHRYLLSLILSVACAAIYFCHSRAGLGMTLILLATMMLFPAQSSRRALLPSLIWSLATLLLCTQLHEIYAILVPAVAKAVAFFTNSATSAAEAAYVQQLTALLQVSIERQSGDLERWTSITDGWAMWLERPIFGNGLGAYMHHYLSTTGGPLVIHSVPVWLLAETGLVGLLVVAGTFGIAIRHAFRGMAMPETAGWAIGLLVALVCLGAATTVHDFFFQRSFWFLLGLLAALPNDDRTTGAPAARG